jgi:DTW domain-containing protein YfiP
MTVPAPRTICARCRRPEVVCWCEHLPYLPSRTRIVILQHPREREVPIGTARMAHLALPNSILRVGVDFSDDCQVAGALDGAYLLFPGEQASDVRQLALAEPITLVVVDGTWSQARSLARRTPALAVLPRIAFTPRRPSDYRIRRQPADFCVSTIEALAEVLGVLEGRSFETLLDPFRAMVERQQGFAALGAGRHHKRHKRPQGRRTLADRLAAEWPRLVCVHGEGNGWPVRHPDHQPPEVVHFVACRPSDGAIFDALIAPRRPLAPLTAHHLDLPAERILGGLSVEAWRSAWDRFARPDDVIVQWGNYYSKLASADGVRLPSRRIDLRGELKELRGPGGTLQECVARLDAQVQALPVSGRGGRRLAELLALLLQIAP